ncbi:hypothetical protein [Thermoflavimicrobium daqui]|jgi:hypothetical protein|uniref:hypothetical protein n=1 Tax=Thermoflavimicrobium daqui TaxID=2137476 RepID=UPI00143D4BD4|nr:hypothetical protein [Thermoflavimicrobium daqui]
MRTKIKLFLYGLIIFLGILAFSLKGYAIIFVKSSPPQMEPEKVQVSPIPFE